MLGCQAALVSSLLPPFLISAIIIGDVLQETTVDFVMEDCSRSWKRIGGVMPNLRVLLYAQNFRMTFGAPGSSNSAIRASKSTKRPMG